MSSLKNTDIMIHEHDKFKLKCFFDDMQSV